ncbi:lipase family alpha/beta hydrolase [Halodesulfovibrio spirochaetisodalis]|uniref:AB hydrolase-1 domain-containing protein n=1 Tax=Halodesulfovibrio spirochaetisodalis TaxID=1560234 RepID=A0A1B7XBG7_9BACT|nr:alpha/beta hydrolase [Halodesulfovibrio spirochaetisodalis]OBQ50105.1 hypothetical protein SP90_10690 [Halodesulfovibrio spirochaetisodalis]
MLRKKFSFWIAVLCFQHLIGCSALHSMPQKVHCSSNCLQSADNLLLKNGLVCKPDSGNNAFPVTSRIITDLTYPLFSVKRKNTGVDAPADFWNSGYGGLYQITGNSEQLIIIYINGYKGRPTGWKRIYASLQSLGVTHVFFNYPTGESLHTTTDILVSLLESNAEQLQHSRIVLIGHSQGGLIAVRTAQLLYEHRSNIPVHHIVTIATPWDGCNLAGYAKLVNPFSPKVFDDLDSGSDFIHAMKQCPLSPKTAYTLIYGATMESSQTPYPNDNLFSTTNQLATGRVVTPSATHCAITTHEDSIRNSTVVEFVTACIKQCISDKECLPHR